MTSSPRTLTPRVWLVYGLALAVIGGLALARMHAFSGSAQMRVLALTVGTFAVAVSLIETLITRALVPALWTLALLSLVGSLLWASALGSALSLLAGVLALVAAYLQLRGRRPAPEM